MITVDLTQPEYIETYHNIKRAFLERQGYTNIITYMVDSSMKENENYEYYWEKYLEALLNYQIQQKEFEEKVIIPETNNKGGNWNIDFMKEVVNID